MSNEREADRAAQLRRAIRLKKAAAARRAGARRDAAAGTDDSARTGGSGSLPPAPRDAPRRLGELQRAVWLAHQLAPGDPAYNLVSAWRVRGTLDVATLERAFQRVVARHRILRSTYHGDGGEVSQRIAPPSSAAELRLERLVVAAGVSAEQAAVGAAQQPFDLGRGPLVRCVLIEPAAGAPVAMLVLHHLLADERSLEILWAEIAELYADGAEDAHPRAGNAGAPRLQYDDWTHWSRSRLEGAGADADAVAARREAERSLRSRLDPPPPAAGLPYVATPSPAAGSRAAAPGARPGRLISHRVDAGVAAAVRELARRCACTPYAVYTFAFRLLLDRTLPDDGPGDGPAADQDVADAAHAAADARAEHVFGTPVSLRSHPATRDMVGYFLAPAVLTAGVDSTRGTEEGLGAWNASLRRALADAEAPLDRVLEDLPAALRSGQPLLQLFFVHQQLPAARGLGDATLEPLLLDLGSAKFDLTLFVGERAPGAASAEPGGEPALELALEYRSDRFDAAGLERLLNHYRTVLERLPHHRGRLGELSMLGDDEAAALDLWQRGAELDAGSQPLLPQRIDAALADAAEREAVVGAGERWSATRLRQEASRVAAALRR
ncbi:MAG: hypothetical protein DWQ36_08870, partial [Acidobacteria bacterium]